MEKKGTGTVKRIACYAATALLWCFVGAFCVTALADEEYGADAYAYMEYLQETYPYRAVNTQTAADAQAWLEQVVTGFGYSCEALPFYVEYNGAVYQGNNLVFEKKGSSDTVIVVGAHYDCVEQTRGTDDNATGVGVLLESAKRLASETELPYTIRYILFSAEEPGCLGSQYYVDSLSQEERDQILCMINLDTLGAGDYMYLYGGGVDESGATVRTWLVEQAMQVAEYLELDMRYHPDVNSQYPVPVKNTYSDQQAFDGAGITYLYFEASNWNGGDYNNIYQTADERVENGKMLHTPAYENLEFYHEAFGDRIETHLTAYSALLDYLLHNLQPWTAQAAFVSELDYEECSETVWAVSNVNIRTAPSTSSAVLDVLREDEAILMTGYNADWCRVEYDGQTAYIKTEYLTQTAPETEAEETTTEVQQTTEELLVEVVTDPQGETEPRTETTGHTQTEPEMESAEPEQLDPSAQDEAQPSVLQNKLILYICIAAILTAFLLATVWIILRR